MSEKQGCWASGHGDPSYQRRTAIILERESVIDPTMYVMVWHGLAWSGMAWHRVRRMGRRGTEHSGPSARQNNLGLTSLPLAPSAYCTSLSILDCMAEQAGWQAGSEARSHSAMRRWPNPTAHGNGRMACLVPGSYEPKVAEVDDPKMLSIVAFLRPTPSR